MDRFRDKKRIVVLAGAGMAAAGIIIACIVLFSPKKLILSEICAANDGRYEEASVRDSDGKLCDWVEVYNPNDKEVSLKGYSICRDDGKESAISTGSVPAHGYAVIYCTKNGFDDPDVPYADIKISRSGNNTISIKSGNRVIDSLAAEPTEKGFTVCAGEDGAYITLPTPCAENSEERYASQVVFSAESGFYPEGFELEMTAANSAGIYYTTDGTDPRTSDTAEIYGDPVEIKDRAGDRNVLSAYDPMKIQLEYRKGKVEAPKDKNVDKGTVIRACARDSKGEWGKVCTEAYFVGFSTEDHSGLPVISMVTDPDSLYDHETGIYVRGKVYEDFYPTEPDHLYNGSIPANYNQRGKEWERPCTLQFFESDGSLVFNQDAGMRIQGGWSRADYQKSFRFYARSEYGSKSFDYSFWQGLETAGDQDDDSFSTLVLRNGGNDSNFLKFKDIMIQDMAKGLLPPTQAGRPCVLFIDGEYWGLYTLQEDYTQEYFARHYGVKEDSVAIYKNDEIDEGLAVDEMSYNSMQSFIAGSDMSTEENYRRACELMDMDNFIDYCAVQMYIFNDDWPQNNYGCWRSNDGSEYGDGKWRFFLFDTESCACHYDMDALETDIFDYLDKKSHKPLTKMILSLLENDSFRMKLTTRLMDMGNIVYTPERTENFVNKYRALYLPEMPAYYRRFPTHRTVERSAMPMLKRMGTFFNSRREKLIKDLSYQYTLGRAKTVTVESDRDGLTLNGLDIQSGFEGKYFRNCVLTLTAGGSDVTWKVTRNGKTTEVNDSTLVIKITADTEIRAE
jgi:hypothetical protein